MITTGSIVRIILISSFFFALYYVRDLLFVVLAAIVIASAVEPVIRWFGRYKVQRLPAVLITYITIGALLSGFFLFFVPSLLSETVGYLDNLPQSISVGDLWQTSSLSSKSFPIREIVGNFSQIIAGTGEGTFKTVSIVFGGALSFVLMIVLSFYLAVQEDGVGNFLRIITPIKNHEYIINLWKRSQAKMGYWLQGQVLLAVIVGVLVYLGLVILGVRHALLLATLAGIFEIIPIFGPILASFPAIVISYVDGGVSLGLLVLGLYVIIHQFENHLFYPLVVKKIVGISPIIVILALVVGAKLAGFIGAILAVPLSAALMEYVSDIEKDKVNHV